MKNNSNSIMPTVPLTGGVRTNEQTITMHGKVIEFLNNKLSEGKDFWTMELREHLGGKGEKELKRNKEITYYGLYQLRKADKVMIVESQQTQRKYRVLTKIVLTDIVKR